MGKLRRPNRPIRPPKLIPPPPPIAAVPGGIPGSILAAHNQARAAEGKPALALDSRLQQAASDHAEIEAANLEMSHDGFPQRLYKAGYPATAAVGENVAEGGTTTEEIVAAWLNSAEHRANIMGEFCHLGAMGVLGTDGVWYWCACYGNSRT